MKQRYVALSVTKAHSRPTSVQSCRQSTRTFKLTYLGPLPTKKCTENGCWLITFKMSTVKLLIVSCNQWVRLIVYGLISHSVHTRSFRRVETSLSRQLNALVLTIKQSQRGNTLNARKLTLTQTNKLSLLKTQKHIKPNPKIRCLKKVPPLNSLWSLSNLNRFSKLLQCWKVYEICYKTHTALPTSP